MLPSPMMASEAPGSIGVEDMLQPGEAETAGVAAGPDIGAQPGSGTGVSSQQWSAGIEPLDAM